MQIQSFDFFITHYAGNYITWYIYILKKKKLYKYIEVDQIMST